MAWHTTSPIGNISVRANRTVIGDNFTYIEDTMGNEIVGNNKVTTRDHFWNVSGDVDGRHRFIQSVGFTVGGNPEDPVIGTGMQSVLYAKTTNTRVEWFHRNAEGIYQFIPSFLSGTVIVGAGYGTIVTVPINVYGEIFMWLNAAGKNNGQSGFFKSNGTKVDAWSYAIGLQGQTETINLKFGNGTDSTTLDIVAKASAASAGNTWNYRITYRAI